MGGGGEEVGWGGEKVRDGEVVVEVVMIISEITGSILAYPVPHKK